MNLNEAIRKAWRKSVLLKEEQDQATKPVVQPEVKEKEPQVKVQPQQPKQEPKKEIQPQQPKQEPKKEIQPQQPEKQPEQELTNPIDLENISIVKLYNTLKDKVVSDNLEFIDEDAKALIGKLSEVLSKWSQQQKIDNMTLEFKERTSLTIEAVIVFKSKEYPITITLNPDKADNKSKTYQDLVKAGGFKDLSNPEDQTEIKDETTNYVANGYIQILKQIGE